MKVEFFKHSIQEEDIQNVVNTLNSVFLTTGPLTCQFEKKFAEFTGLQHIVALNSCTAALHLALLALGIGPGDEVITSPMTFIATATAITHTGATPVFADVIQKNGLIDPNCIVSAIGPKTKAIIPVHLYGTMVDMKALRQIADQHNLFIIEDAAHCIEGERDSIRPGQLSDAACYSFYATKNLTCGEGGALGTNNNDLAKKIRLLRQHGMSKEAADRYNGTYQHWDMVELGWKYNFNDILSALLINQIDRLHHQLEQRNHLYEQYIAALVGLNITIPEIIGKSAYHLFTVWVPAHRRDLVLKELGNYGIGATVNYRAIHTLKWFKQQFGYLPDAFPNAFEIGSCTISLPFYIKLKTEELLYVVNCLKKILNRSQ